MNWVFSIIKKKFLIRDKDSYSAFCQHPCFRRDNLFIWQLKELCLTSPKEKVNNYNPIHNFFLNTNICVSIGIFLESALTDN